MSQSRLNNSADCRISLISWANDIVRNLNEYAWFYSLVIEVCLDNLYKSCILNLLKFL